jgi:hypothetical protein
MSEIQRIEDQLRRAFEGHAWHGPAVRELLADVTAAKAAGRPLPSAHSIWEIVLHMATWERVVRRRCRAKQSPIFPLQRIGRQSATPAKRPGVAPLRSWNGRIMTCVKRSHKRTRRISPRR